MGNLAVDTQVEMVNGRYLATLSRDWELIGPSGGYLASIALRAAGAASRFTRPASFAAHYLSIATFESVVELEVHVLRTTRNAESLRVSMTQKQNPILEALVWTVGSVPGLEHQEIAPPEVPSHHALKTRDELFVPGQRTHKFWNNFVNKPVDWIHEMPVTPLAPALRSWFKYSPVATFDDPFVDAARSLLLLDTQQWPAAIRRYAHQHQRQGFFAPTIDIAVNFHRLVPEAEWLLCVTEAPVAHAGLVGGRAATWSDSGQLLASGTGHLLCRSVPLDTYGCA